MSESEVTDEQIYGLSNPLSPLLTSVLLLYITSPNVSLVVPFTRHMTVTFLFCGSHSATTSPITSVWHRADGGPMRWCPLAHEALYCTVLYGMCHSQPVQSAGERHAFNWATQP